MGEVILHGMWASPYSLRAAMALKLKGISYSYVEEDLHKKSPEILHYNPVHKKVPVLVHNGKPIAESLVILEYIEDTWKDTPLLPQDPYLRSRVRFWAHFYDNTFAEASRRAILQQGEEQKKALEEFQGLLNTLEEGLVKDFSWGTPYLHGQEPGFLDIVIGSSACSHKSFEEATGVTLFHQERNPTYMKWLCHLKENPFMKELLPPHDKMVAYVKTLRKMILQLSEE